MLTLTFEITLLSNYHSGAGYGKGFGLDSALLREADGTPVLRGSGLAGLFRDSVYRLLKLKPLSQHNTNEVQERLFGSPARAKRWHFSSARPVERQSADAQIVQRVRIDPRTRRAEPRKLFSQEEGNAGQVFRFTITCAATDEAALDDAALLVAAARYIRQLGRSRRRGLGECVIHLTEVSGMKQISPDSWEAWFLERFERAWLRGQPAPIESTVAKADLPAVQAGTSHGPAVRVRVIVRLDEPLLIAERAPAGNQFDARPVIPGSVILGALASQAAEHCDLADPNHYHNFVALFRRGGVLFPTLYPAHEYSNNLYPAIPAPLGMLTCSVVPFEGDDAGHGTYIAKDVQECRHCSNRLEPVAGFVVLKRGNPYTLRVSRSSELHIQVDEETGRVKTGQLYGYTVLDAGQYFVGELLCTDEDTWTRLKEMTGITEETPLTWRLGKARRRGYGQVTVWLGRCDSAYPTWIQIPLEKRVTDPGRPISLTLLTDTIIADPWGRQVVGFTKEWLESVLGLGPVQIQDAYARTRSVDSFNATLGLPRWRDTVLMAGSVVWFQLQAPPKDWPARMQKLETEGIGLRRNEGYGRVAFNHPVYERREELQESAIRLEERMRQASRPTKDTFITHWEKELEETLPKKLDPRFGALARWLYAHRDESPETLLNQLNAVGEPDQTLIDAIGGESEYGSRSKDNFFAQEGKAGIQAICKALEYLKEKDQQNWSRGVAVLADQLAARAGDKVKGGAQ
jgi:CRISPR-associated protein Csx10